MPEKLFIKVWITKDWVQPNPVCGIAGTQAE